MQGIPGFVRITCGLRYIVAVLRATTSTGGTEYAPNREVLPRACGNPAWFMSVDSVGVLVAAIAALIGLSLALRYQSPFSTGGSEPPPEGRAVAPTARSEQFGPAPVPSPRPERPTVVPLLAVGVLGLLVFSLLRRKAH
jgi:hypothetical protein